jgi:hypothetical protein
LHSSRLFIPVFLCLLFVGCSTVRVSHDYDPGVNFAGMRTFAWADEKQPETGDIRLDDPLLDRRIRTAVDQTLRKKGFAPVDRGTADFLVAYQLGVQRAIRSDNVQTGFRFSTGSRGRYGSVGISTGTNIQSYDKGTLFIDVLDPENGSLLWRGKGTDSVSEHSDQKRRTEKIREAVEKILGQFPPGSG